MTEELARLMASSQAEVTARCKTDSEVKDVRRMMRVAMHKLRQKRWCARLRQSVRPKRQEWQSLRLRQLEWQSCSRAGGERAYSGMAGGNRS